MYIQKGDVCATIWGKVASCPENHRSADRCQQYQMHYRMTVSTKFFAS